MVIKERQLLNELEKNKVVYDIRKKGLKNKGNIRQIIIQEENPRCK